MCCVDLGTYLQDKTYTGVQQKAISILIVVANVVFIVYAFGVLFWYGVSNTVMHVVIFDYYALS